jgi:hypothetical protein
VAVYQFFEKILTISDGSLRESPGYTKMDVHDELPEVRFTFIFPAMTVSGYF